jgi:SAM-dependent methyltransferase/uncharacterized protein YbaR (Trm112 family)
LLNWLRCPQTGDPLEAVSFAARPDPAGGETDIVEGLLVARPAGHLYAITGGVPVLLADGLPPDFYAAHRARIDAHAAAAAPPRVSAAASWSFSNQWEEHWRRNAARTWGWTAGERVEQFYLETETDPAAAAGRWLLDAGCGNGLLSHALAAGGLNVIALDLSVGVFYAERHRTSGRVHYVRGDLRRPPFAAGAFDLVVSNGVLHHTPNTLETFTTVGRLVRPGGKYYAWLYHWPRTFAQRWIKRPVFEVARAGISRLPSVLQRGLVHVYARAVHARNLAFRRPALPFPELLVEVYDFLTPRYRSYHTPLQVGEWFYRNGFGAARLTHWDNPHGFGMMAERRPLAATPGVRYRTPSPDSTQVLPRAA